jgi:REP element-mobilizing transposase RayT
MSHAYARNHVHVVFSTRQRQRAISADIQPKLWAYLHGIAKNYALDMLAIGGTEDHVHLLLVLPPKLSLANAIRTLKANSSKWMNESGHFFSWQDGYAAFSVSTSSIDAVRAYIENQAEHHKRRSFAEEFVTFLNKNGVDFTPDHVLG